MIRVFQILIFVFSTIVVAQDVGSVAGSLSDKDNNNEPLPFANVIIKGTSKGTTTDFDGNYLLDNIAVGTYTIEFSFVGYETLEVPNVVIEAGKVTNITTALGASAAALDEVIIKTTARKESEVALLLDQKKAVTIKQSIGADELSRKGVSDAAAAVSKISGISKQQGGGNVYVRGLGDRYLNTTYNGLTVPSNDIEKKNIDLGLFSSDVIQNIGVSKTHAANFYGDFAAGNVDIVSKEYTGKFFITAETGSSINTRAVDKNFVKSEGTSFFGYYNRYDNNPFAVVVSHGVDPESASGPVAFTGAITTGNSWNVGEESRLSVFGTVSFSNDFEYRRGTQVDFTTVEKKRFPDSEEFEYSTNTTAMANIGYKINNNHRLTFNSLFINDATDEVGYFGIGGNGTNRDAILNTDKGFYQMNVQFDQDMVFVNQLTGKSRLNDKLEVEYGIGFNNVLARQPDRKRISVERYDLALDNDPNTNPFFYSNIAFDNQRYFQEITDNELNARINLNYKHSEELTFNFGYNGRSKTREFENVRYGYDFINGTSTEVPDINNLDAVFSPENIGELYDIFVFNAIDPSQGITNRNNPGLPENIYEGELNVQSAYVDAEIKSGEKWTFVPGLRLEYFDQRIDYDVINVIATDPGFREADELFILPSLNIKYALNEDQNLRFSASRTVSTPEFKEVAPFVYEDVTQRIGGNPDLLADPAFSSILNLDLKYEWFFGRSELFSLGAFAKQINDPVNLVVANDATGTQRFARTGDKAEVLGAEIEIRKNLMVDEDENSIFSTGANVTVMHTKQDLKSSQGFISTTFDRDSDELQGASPLLINADVSYSPTFGTYKPVANLIVSYFSDRIDALGSGQLGNITEKSVTTLDFVWKNHIGDHLEINASAKNLLDPTIERVRENNGGDITISNYKRGINVGLQLKYNF